jgi:hypothetical protein
MKTVMVLVFTDHFRPFSSLINYLSVIIIDTEITRLDTNINGAEILLRYVEPAPTWQKVDVVVISVDLPENGRSASCVWHPLPPLVEDPKASFIAISIMV